MAVPAPANPEVSGWKQYEIWRQMRVEYARRCAKAKDVLGWAKACFPETLNLPYCQEMHGYFVDIRGEDFTGTEAPRNHAKTVIKCKVIPLFQALEEPETFHHYLNVQATQPKALSVNISIRNELETNEVLHALYGDMVGPRWTDQQFVLSNKVIFTALGAGQSVRGINYLSERPDYELVDDLYDEEHIHNPEATRKLNDWFWSSLYPARARSRRCSIHVQGTAINPYDLLEQLKSRKGVRCRTFKAIKNFETKEVLWPELNTFDSLILDRDERMGPIIFAREMQNERMDEQTTILKRSYWKYYTELPSGFDLVVASWDMTFKETKSGSYVVGQVWGKRGANFYLFPIMVRGRMDFVEAVAAVQNLNAQYPHLIQGTLVEDKANGSAVMSVLQNKISGLVPILPHGTKVARAVAITPPLAAGNVFIPDPSIAPWVPEYIEEAAKFRGADSEINDQVDTTTQAINYLRGTRYPGPEDEQDGDSFIETGDDGDSDAVGGFES